MMTVRNDIEAVNTTARSGFSSEELYQDCSRGSSEAWNEAAQYVHGVLSRFCWQMSTEERNDLVNETLLYFLSRGLGEIEQPRAFKKLLKLKAKAVAIDHRRKIVGMKIQEPPQSNSDDDSPPGEYFPPTRDDCESTIFAGQALKICRLIISSLKKECSELLPMYFSYKVSGDGVGKLAEDLQKPLGSIAASVHRCLKKLYSHPQIEMLRVELNGGTL